MDSKWTEEQIFIDEDAENRVYGTCYKIKKSKLKVKNTKNRFFIFVVILLLAGISYFVVNISSHFVSAQVANADDVYIASQNYYAISLSSTKDIQACQSVASQCKMLGGAGYVYTLGDENYILVSVYNNIEQAQSVLNKLKQTNYNDATIINLSANKVDFSNVYKQSSNKSNLIKLLLLFNNAFDLYYNLINNYDLSQLSYIQCKEKILLFYNEYTNIFESVKKDLKTEEKFLKSVQNVLNITQSNSDIFASQDNFSSNLKYSLIQIVINRLNL